MKHITTQDALRALEEAVAEKGEDYVYERIEAFDDGEIISACAYVDLDGNPSCLAGNALLRLGVSREVLEDYSTGYDVRSLVRTAALPIDPVASDVLLAAQMEQDEGATWGRALEKARAVATDA